MINLPFNTVEFAEAWTDWLEYKKEEFNFKYKSKHSMKAVLKKIVRLSKNNEQTAILIIEESMAGKWKGFWSLKVAKDKPIMLTDKMKQQYRIH